MLTLVFLFHVTTWCLQDVRMGSSLSPQTPEGTHVPLSLEGSSVAHIEDLSWHCTGGRLPKAKVREIF